jgi:Skp family chaperone for outer membrane proteins
MKERGASLAVPKAATLQHAPRMDITGEVVTRLDNICHTAVGRLFDRPS